MSWRADWGGELIGRAATVEEAQALCAPDQGFAIVTNEETGERFIREPAGWRAYTRAELPAPKTTPPGRYWWQEQD